MALPYTDTFTGTTGTILTTYSADWTFNNSGYTSQQFQIVSNAARGWTSGSSAEIAAHINSETFNNNQYAQGVIVALVSGAYIGLSVRCASGSTMTFYNYISDSSDGSYLAKTVSGSYTQLGSKGSAFTTSLTVRLEVNGSTITPKRNGSTADIGAQTDSSISSGYAGLSVYSGADSRVDDFEGGNLTSTISGTANQVTETDAAQGITRVKRKEIGQAVESNAAQPITRYSVTTVAVGLVTETDTAQTITPVKRNSPPVVASSNNTNGTSLSGGVGLNMPSGIVAGDLLIAFASNDNTGGVNMGISGWTQLFHTQYTGNVVSHGAWAKIAVGSDTATLTGASQDYAACVIRVTDHGVTNIATDIKVGTAATGATSTPNPPSLDSGSTKRWLWIASNGSDDDDNSATYAPADYTAIAQVESAQSSSSTMIQVAYRVNGDVQTEDPGTFALGASEEWVAQTIAIPPAASGITRTVNQTSETDTAQAVTRQKVRAAGQISETDLAQPVGAGKGHTIGQPVETDLAQAITRIKRVTVNQVVETDAVQSITRYRPSTTVSAGQASETDLAQAIIRQKVRAAGQISETDLAQAIARRKIHAAGQTTEADAAQAVTRQKVRAAGQISETDLAQAITRIKRVTVNQVVETDAVQPIARRKVKAAGQATETDTAQAVNRRTGNLVQQTEETDQSQPVTRVKRKTVNQVVETDAVQPISRRKIKTIGQVMETDQAQPITRRSGTLVQPVEETDLAQALFPLKRVHVVQAADADAAQPIRAIKVLAIGQAAETDLAQEISVGGRLYIDVGIAVEVDLCFAITRRKMPPKPIMKKAERLPLGSYDQPEGLSPPRRGRRPLGY